jgi:OCT family organic cation transporter-like MFS transporter 4/5
MVLLAFLTREWTYLQLSFAVTSLGLATIYFLVPESPRWLLEKGRYDQVPMI